MQTESFRLNKVRGEHHPLTISVFTPFNPKLLGRSAIELQLQSLIQKVEQKLSEFCTPAEGAPLIDRLKSFMAKLDFATYKQSVGIFISKSIAKAYYLDIPLTEKIIIDGSFEIRELVKSKADAHKYLVLVLSSSRSRVFLGNSCDFRRIAFNTSEFASAYKNDIAERVANFTDIAQRKEVVLDKFLHHIENGLGIVLNSYNLPLFVMGSEKVMGHFKNITHFRTHIVEYIPGNFDACTDAGIQRAIQPYVADWKKVQQQDIMHRLDDAASAHKIAMGINEVYEQAAHKRGKLLVVEKDYTYQNLANNNNGESHIKDTVDEAIESVLQNGGDVEFVDAGLLEKYDHIALTLYY
jgi:hypothetical protein